MEDAGAKNPSEIPFSGGRVDAVIDKYKKIESEAQVKADDLQGKEMSLLGNLHQAVEDRDKLEASNQAQENKFGRLGGLFGKKGREEAEQSAAANVGAAEAVLNQNSEGILTNLGQVEHAEEEIAANKLGGPTEISSKMTEALKQQDVIKVYAEFGYPVEGAKLPTKELFDNLRDFVYQLKFKPGIEENQKSFEGQKTYLAENREYLEKNGYAKGYEDRIKQWTENLPKRIRDAEMASAEVVLNITPFIEVATEICDKENIPLSQRLMETAIKEGMQITQGVEGKYLQEAWNFVKEKKNGSVSSNDVAYYAIGASQLDKFFKNRPNIEGRNRLPYVIAYAAGALANGAPSSMPYHLRNWLSETIPGAGIDSNREGGKWVVKQTEPYARGFGYFLSDGRDRNQYDEGQTYERGWVDIVTEANEIALKIYDKLGEKRRFNAQNNYKSGSYGRPQFGVPVLREPDS
ncbi:MAG: hypothetical protein NT162_03495 [Candidatus Woesebacteria bacterium]|nr:hypothetical protein [Candidatus Woesebacteria bacterium]